MTRMLPELAKRIPGDYVHGDYSRRNQQKSIRWSNRPTAKEIGVIPRHPRQPGLCWQKKAHPLTCYAGSA